MKYSKLTLARLRQFVNKLGGMDDVKSFLAGELSMKKAGKNKFFKLISDSENIVIDAVDGSETLYEAIDIFSHRDPAFLDYDANEIGPATKETPVGVYEMAQDATFTQMFGSLSNNLDKLCFTQAQIKNFVVKHRSWLRTDSYGTFFLFKSKNNFFVASVFLFSDVKLGVRVYRLSRDSVWGAGGRPRVVVPQLI